MPVRLAAVELLGDWGCRAGRRSAVSDLDLASAGWGWLPGEVRAWQLSAWQELAWRRQDEPGPERVPRSAAAVEPLPRAWRPWVGSPPPACSPPAGALELPVWPRQDGSEPVVPGSPMHPAWPRPVWLARAVVMAGRTHGPALGVLLASRPVPVCSPAEVWLGPVPRMVWPVPVWRPAPLSSPRESPCHRRVSPQTPTWSVPPISLILQCRFSADCGSFRLRHH